MDITRPVDGSFRDPSGQVFIKGRAILRAVRPVAVEDYEFVRSTGLLPQLAAKGWMISGEEIDPALLDATFGPAPYLLQHPRLPFISHPYEWSFGGLRSAAVRQLDLYLAALDSGLTLSDASAYNFQFLDANPLFIDYLSFRRYRPGEFWNGYRQFCEQFLNPLLLHALRGLPFQPWYRGSIEGISAVALTKALPLRQRVSWRALLHVTLQARAQVAAEAKEDVWRPNRRRRLHPEAFRSLLRQLRRWVAGLEPRRPRRTLWSHYSREHTYSSTESSAKAQFVREAIARWRPSMLWDLGCNTGAYSELAVKAGASLVIGFETDPLALEMAFARARDTGIPFVPLYSDVANPSPSQGWAQAERPGLVERGPASTLLALAFVHHLAIGRNVPLPVLVPWLIRLADSGVLEFVDKRDQTVQRMLALREDVFLDYTRDMFEASIRQHARIVKTLVVSESGRTLYAYER